MNDRVILVALCAAACAAPTPPETERTTIEAPIVNGSLESGWSAVGALTFSYPGYGYQGSFCTGTLIAPSWVLTAAHCLTEHEQFTISPPITTFLVGTDATPGTFGGPKSGTLYQADAFYLHPDFDNVYNDNDIALVHLSEPVSGVTPVAVNAAYQGSLAGQTAFYVGFGATEGIGSTGSGVKRSTSVPVSWIYDTVYVSDWSGSGTCFGDSGGPALMQLNGQWRIIGVNSALAGCEPGDPNCPQDPCQGSAITTRADVYAAWVASVTGAPLPNCNQVGGCFCAGACLPSGVCDNSKCQVLDCKGLYECLSDCNSADSGCPIDCYAAGTAEGKQELNALQTCIQQQCGSLTGQAYQQCVGQNCQDAVNTCLPVGTGPLSCGETYGCLVECPQDDNGCALDCYEQGTSSAQVKLDAMLACLQNQCGQAADFQTCAAQQCSSQIDACLPPVFGGATCREVYDCFATCAEGDATCSQACYETGDQTAQAAVQALSACINDQCADAATNAALQQCVIDECAAQYNGCFPPANCPINGGGCPAGEACYPGATGATDCFPSQELGPGAACVPTGSVLACADGLLCVSGVCQQACTQPQHCGVGGTCAAGIFQNAPAVGVCEMCPDGDADGVCTADDCDDADPAVGAPGPGGCGDGTDGTDGVSGNDGVTGADGPTDGADSSDGADGVEGSDGADGLTGATDGNDGSDGNDSGGGSDDGDGPSPRRGGSSGCTAAPGAGGPGAAWMILATLGLWTLRRRLLA